MGGDVYVNPFNSREQIDQFIQKRDEHQKFKESRVKEKLFCQEIIENTDILLKQLSHSAVNKRIPLVLSSKQLYTNLATLETLLKVSDLFNPIRPEEKQYLAST